MTAVLAASPWLASQAMAGPRDDTASRRLMHDYARCVVQTKHERASNYIVADETNETLIARYPDLISPDCMGRTGGNVSVKFGGDLYRYAIADALVNADYAAEGPNDFTDRLPLAHFVMPDQARLDADLAKTKSKARQEELKKAFARTLTVGWLSRFGECVVRLDPVNARLLLLTPPDTSEETSRINMLRPAFSACLQNGTIKFNRITVRGVVAINYYRLAKATPVAAARKVS